MQVERALFLTDFIPSSLFTCDSQVLYTLCKHIIRILKQKNSEAVQAGADLTEWVSGLLQTVWMSTQRLWHHTTAPVRTAVHHSEL